ncbi:MAG: YihY/virulence factor BrkB family protein [Aquabacterium sp.]
MHLPLKTAWRLAKEAVTSWVDDYGQSMGAALAYYTVFSLAPLLLIVISVAGLVFGPDAARGEILTELQGMMGEDAAHAVQGLLESTNQPKTGTVATLIGAIMLLVGATTVFAELQTSLDRIWRVPAQTSSGIWSLLRTRFLSFGMILGIGFLLMVSLIFSAMLSALENWWEPWFRGWATLASVVNQVASFGLTTAAFAMIYKIMPRARIQWPDVWVGAAVTAALFTVGKYLIGLYIGKSGVTSVFGAAGSLVVVLVWVYYSAQIFLIGAEFTWVYAHQIGSRKGQPRPGAAEPVPSRHLKAA